MARAKWTTKPDYMAECQDCEFYQAGRQALGSAARHHDATGHVLRVNVESAVYYGEDRPGQRRWWKAPGG